MTDTSGFDAMEREDYAQLEKLRVTLELETQIPHTVLTFAEIRVRRLEAERKKMRAALKLAKASLKELIADPEIDFGPAYSLAQARQAEALAAVKDVLKKQKLGNMELPDED